MRQRNRLLKRVVEPARVSQDHIYSDVTISRQGMNIRRPALPPGPVSVCMVLSPTAPEDGRAKGHCSRRSLSMTLFWLPRGASRAVPPKSS